MADLPSQNSNPSPRTADKAGRNRSGPAEASAERAMARTLPVSDGPAASPQTLMLATALVVVTLYYGADLLVPMALAILLTFVLAPIVRHLERWRLGRIPSVLVVVALVFAGITGFGMVVGGQLADLANNIPNYQQNLKEKIANLRTSLGGESDEDGVVHRVTEALENLQDELQRTTREAVKPSSGNSSSGEQPKRETINEEPMLVRVEGQQQGPVRILTEILGPVLAPLATAGMVLVLTIFMLLEREDLRDRVIKLVGANDLNRTTEALSDAGDRVSRYLLMQVIVNVTYGIPVGIGLWLLGVPNPVLWGMLAIVLRFIPYVGPFISAAFPILLSFAVAPGWTLPLMTIALFVIIELFSNNVVEPWLYGSATGLSALAIIIAAIFWTALWGPVGLLLATPLTVCVVVLGRHVPSLAFLEVMLGDKPVLPDDVKVYQRLLARDPLEAAEVVELRLADEDFVTVADAILLPALGHAEVDRQRRTLTQEGRANIAEGMADVLEELDDVGEPRMTDRNEDDTVTGDNAPVPAQSDACLLCIGARNDLDTAAAGLIADIAERHGLRAELIQTDRQAPRQIAMLNVRGVSAIAVSCLNQLSLPNALRLVRRLHQRFGDVPIILCLWSNGTAETTHRAALLEQFARDRRASTLREAVNHLRELGLIADETISVKVKVEDKPEQRQPAPKSRPQA